MFIRTPHPKIYWIQWTILAVALVAGLVVRAIYANVNLFLSVDAVYYVSQARDLVATGHLPLSSFPPGWPLLTVPFLLFFNIDDPMAPLRAAQIANVLFGTAFGLLTYIILARSCNRWLALFGALVILLMPQNILFSKGAMSEMSFACILLGAWLLLEKRYYFWTGILQGYLYLIRPEALIIPLGVTLFHILRTKKIPWTFLGGVLLMVLPYVLFLKIESGHWTLTAKMIFLENTMSNFNATSMLNLSAANVTILFKRLILLIGLPLVLLAPLGCLSPKRSWLLFMAPLLSLPFFDFDMNQRYWLPYLPFVFMSFFLGVSWVVKTIPRGMRKFVPLALFLIAGSGLGHRIVVNFPKINYNSESFSGLKKAGLWLRENVESDTKIAAYKPYTAFWAGCEHVQIKPEATALIAIERARQAGAEYLIINTRITLSILPMMKPLLVSPLPEHLASEVRFVLLIKYDNVNLNTAIYAINH